MGSMAQNEETRQDKEMLSLKNVKEHLEAEDWVWTENMEKEHFDEIRKEPVKSPRGLFGRLPAFPPLGI